MDPWEASSLAEKGKWVLRVKVTSSWRRWRKKEEEGERWANNFNFKIKKSFLIFWMPELKSGTLERVQKAYVNIFRGSKKLSKKILTELLSRWHSSFESSFCRFWCEQNNKMFVMRPTKDTLRGLANAITYNFFTR